LRLASWQVASDGRIVRAIQARLIVPTDQRQADRKGNTMATGRCKGDRSPFPTETFFDVLKESLILTP